MHLKLFLFTYMCRIWYFPVYKEAHPGFVYSHSPWFFSIQCYVSVLFCIWFTKITMQKLVRVEGFMHKSSPDPRFPWINVIQENYKSLLAGTRSPSLPTFDNHFSISPRCQFGPGEKRALACFVPLITQSVMAAPGARPERINSW